MSIANNLEISTNSSSSSTPSVPFKSSNIPDKPIATTLENFDIDDIAAISAKSSGMLLETLNSNGEEKYDYLPSPCVWVGSIPTTVSEEELVNLFKEYGEIVNIRHFSSSKCAFVTFKTTAEAQASLVLEGKEIGEAGNTSQLTLNIGKASRHLWIGNINETVTESRLKSSFEEFGIVESVRILRKNNCGFVNFVSAMDAVRAAEALNDKEIEGQRIVVNFQWNEYIRRTAKKGTDLKAKEMMQREVRKKFQEPSRQLFVGNLVPSVTESTLWTLFMKFGEVESIRAFINRGYAFVIYKELNSAIWVRNQMSAYPPTLGNRRLVVNFGRQPSTQHMTMQQINHNNSALYGQYAATGQVNDPTGLFSNYSAAAAMSYQQMMNPNSYANAVSSNPANASSATTTTAAAVNTMQQQAEALLRSQQFMDTNASTFTTTEILHQYLVTQIAHHHRIYKHHYHLCFIKINKI